jgi:hypothetical protein
MAMNRISVTVTGPAGQFQIDLGVDEPLEVVLDHALLILVDSPHPDAYALQFESAVLHAGRRSLASLAEELGWGSQVELLLVRRTGPT